MARLLICSSRISYHNSPCRFPKMFTQLLKYVALTWYIFLYFRSEACKSLCAEYFWMKLLEMTTFLQMRFLSANKFEIHWNDKLCLKCHKKKKKEKHTINFNDMKHMKHSLCNKLYNWSHFWKQICYVQASL